MNDQTAEAIADEWAKHALGAFEAKEREERFYAMRRALIALVPEDPPDWTLTPTEPPQLLMLRESALWIVDEGTDGVTIRRVPIDPKRMRLSVTERSASIAADTRDVISLDRTWTLTHGSCSIVLAESKRLSTEQLTPNRHRGELFARAVASSLGWVVPTP